jgi:hypothetical protein
MIPQRQILLKNHLRWLLVSVLNHIYLSSCSVSWKERE